MYRNYVLTYDPISMFSMHAQLLAFIQANAFTYQFFSPYIGLVLIKGTLDLQQMVDSYNSFFNGHNFFMAEVDSVKTGGRLDRAVWDWLNNPAPPPIPYTPLGPK